MTDALLMEMLAVEEDLRGQLAESKQREAELQASKNVLSTWIIELEDRVKTLEDGESALFLCQKYSKEESRHWASKYSECVPLVEALRVRVKTLENALIKSVPLAQSAINHTIRSEQNGHIERICAREGKLADEAMDKLRDMVRQGLAGKETK